MKFKVTKEEMENSIKNLQVRQEQLMNRKAALTNDIQEMQRELENLTPQLAANGAMLQTYQNFFQNVEDDGSDLDSVPTQPMPSEPPVGESVN